MATDRLRRKRRLSDPAQSFIRESMTTPLVLNKIGAAKRMNRSPIEAARKAIIQHADFRRKHNPGKANAPGMENLRAIQKAVEWKKRERKTAALRYSTRPKGDAFALGIDRSKLRQAIVGGIDKGLKGQKLKDAARKAYNNPNVRGLAEPNIGPGPRVKEVVRWGSEHRVIMEPPAKRGRKSYVVKRAKPEADNTEFTASRSAAAKKAWETIRARGGLKKGGG